MRHRGAAIWQMHEATLDVEPLEAHMEEFVFLIQRLVPRNHSKIGAPKISRILDHIVCT
jgi:hypothetical protein